MKYKYIKPIHRYNSDSKRKVTTNESGYLYLMCPECLYMQKIYKQRCTYMELHHSIKDLNYSETISGECPRCKESVIFQEIDFNIARAIDILNEKGYFTVFSCEGHAGNDLDGEDFLSVPYIYFLSNRIVMRAIDKHPLPDTWKFETYGKSIILRSKICNYLNSMKQEEILKIWNQKKEMEDLMEWVDSLEPAYSKEEYAEAKHFFISNSNQIICENAFYSNNTSGVDL